MASPAGLRRSLAVALGAVVATLVLGSPSAARPAPPDDGVSLENGAGSAADSPVTAPIALLAIPRPQLEGLEAAVAEQIRALEAEVEELVASIERTPAARPVVGSAFADLGRVYQAYGLLEPAAAAFTNAIVLVPGDVRWVVHLAVVQQEQGNLEGAAVLLEEALALEADLPAARIRRGDLLLELGRAGEAAAEFERVARNDPTSAAAWAGLGQAALSERRYRKAVEALERALELAPEATRLHYPLGLAWRGLGEAERAVEHLSIRGDVGVRAADPLLDSLEDLKQGERVHLLRGQLAFRAGRFAEAAEAFALALEADPGSVRARVDLAAALAGAGRTSEAISHLETAVGEAPESPTAWFNLGVLRARAGPPEGALEALRRAVALAPEDAGAHAELAAVLSATGRTLEALDGWRRTIELAPVHEEARMAESRILVAQRRWEEARDRLEDGVTALPGSSRLASALARLLAACPDPAVRDGERALDLARKAHAAKPEAFTAETVALALGELDRCEEGWKWQVRALAHAYNGEDRGEDGVLSEKLRTDLDRYRESPCRAPAGVPE